ncbi:UACA protein, partial [Rhinopomastus cyanomelas]|nr:UACA protein [Rhinopomastus cyanomelas]
QLKQLLAETEKLSAEVLGLRGQSTRLQLQLEVGAGTHATHCHPVPSTVTCSPPPSPNGTQCHPSHPPLPPLPQLQQKNHRDIVGVYRTHLLAAAQGFMDEGVHAMLLRILQTE